MQTLKTILVTLIVLAGVWYIGDAIQTREALRVIENRAQSPISEPLVPIAEARATFMQSCDDGSMNSATFSQTEYCGCVFDNLEAQHGVNWIAHMGLQDEQTMQTAVNPTAEACANDQISRGV